MTLTDEQFREHLAWASQVVASWPQWKQDVCRQILQPMSSEPRQPVMTPDEQFLREIDENREAMEPRLIYADWLEERGETLKAEAWRWLGEGWQPKDFNGMHFWRAGKIPDAIFDELCCLKTYRHREGAQGYINAILDAADAFCAWKSETVNR